MKKEDLLKKWLQDDLSPEEQKLFQEMEEAPFYEEIIEEAKRFKADQQIKAAPFSALEHRLHDRNTNKTPWIRIVASIAAVFVVGIGIFYMLTANQLTTVTTSLAQKERVMLPDNSVVVLNGLSSISYNDKNWDDNRTIVLEGEAFFDVEKGKQFDVVTHKGIVSVLGTEFNVRIRDSVLLVACYEGLVQISHQDQVIQLPAGNQYKLVNDQGGKSSIVIAEPFWLKGMSVFERTALNKVLVELEKYYNITIDYSDIDSTVLFTGAFEHDNLENALKAITEPLSLTYVIESNQKVIIRNVQQ